MVRAFLDVFPQTVLLSGWMDELILMGTNAPRIEIDPRRVAARLAAAPALREDLERVHLGTLTELIGTFAAAPATLEAATRSYPPATDDLPLQEYASGASRENADVLATLFDANGAPVWCPACFVDGRPAPGLEGLDRHLVLLGLIYRSAWFQQFRRPHERHVVTLPLDAAVVNAALAGSAYLRLAFPVRGTSP
jgi:hypothetical protein